MRVVTNSEGVGIAGGQTGGGEASLKARQGQVCTPSTLGIKPGGGSFYCILEDNRHNYEQRGLCQPRPGQEGDR